MTISPHLPAIEETDLSPSALSETVDLRTGLIRASGHLSRQGADLLRGTAESLHGNGHVRVTLDLRNVRDADDAGLDVLRGLGQEFAARGGELVIRHAPVTV